MKNKFDTIKEQSNRIKSLFTEERLYGNLVNEQTDEECVTQLQTKGYLITKPTDVSGQYRTKQLKNCLELRNGKPTKMGQVWKFIESRSGNNVKVEVDGSSGSNCKLILSSKLKCDGQEDTTIVSIYGGTPYTNTFNLQVLYNFVDSVKYNPSRLIDVGINYLRYEGFIEIQEDGSGNIRGIDYRDLKINSIYKGNVNITGALDVNADFTSYEDNSGTTSTFKDFIFKQKNISQSGNFEKLIMDDFIECENHRTATILKRKTGY